MSDPARHRQLMDLFDEVCDLPEPEFCKVILFDNWRQRAL